MTITWQSRSVRVGGVTVRCHDTGGGTGTPVVLLHGGASEGGTWQRFAVHLVRAGRRAVAVDLRGHGGSSRSRDYSLGGFRDDVTGLLDELELDSVSLVGHSLGAYVALQVAREAPSRVARLVLEEPPTRPRSGEDAPPISGPAAWLRFAVWGAVGLLRRRRFDPAAVSSAIAHLREPDPLWWEALTSVTAPTLVISGGPSSHLSPDRLAELARTLPDGDLVTLPVGHRVHSRCPEGFAAAVLPFLDENPSPGAA